MLENYLRLGQLARLEDKERDCDYVKVEGHQDGGTRGVL
mgnify:CR=1 FL=1